MDSHGLKPINTKTKIEPKVGIMSNGKKEGSVIVGIEQEEEPASPATRLFHTKALNCQIILIMGCTTRVNVDAIKKGLESTVLNHPRFTSILVVNEKKGSKKWKRTKVNLEEHIVCPDLEGGMDLASADEFVESYTSNLATTPMDLTKPLWEIHILNVKTSEAEAVGVLKLHHSMGDGMSIVSLVLACTRKALDPDALPTIPAAKKQSSCDDEEPIGCFRRFFSFVWFLLMLFWNTVVDAALFSATIFFLKDTNTPMKGSATGGNPRRLVHRTISLDDMKIVKNALNLTINDVLMGMVQAGFSRYLNRRYGNKNGRESSSKTRNLPKNIRLRGSIVFNIRASAGIKALAEMMEKKSKARWGNKIGYVLTSFPIVLLDNPLDYIRQAKAIIDRKKLSLESRFSFGAAKLVQDLFGTKVAAFLTTRVLSHTTFLVSNVVGPQEEITFFGHKLAYAAPTITGLPQAMMIHFQSYYNKMTISMSVDPQVIPDPYQLCDDLAESLQIFKDAVKTSQGVV